MIYKSHDHKGKSNKFFLKNSHKLVEYFSKALEQSLIESEVRY